MGVFKRGRVYYYRFWFNGRLVYESTRQQNKKLAQQLEMEKRYALQKGDLGLTDRASPTFRPAMAEYLEWKQRMTRPNTYRKTKSCSHRLLAYFDNRKLTTITPNDVMAYQQLRSNDMVTVTLKSGVKKVLRKTKPATVNRELATLREVFNYWQRQGVRVDNPVSKVKFQAEDMDVYYVVSQDEEQKYLAKANQPLKDIATIILQTGMRPEEVYTLRKSQVNFEAGWVQVDRGKTRSARRKLYMTPAVQEILENRKKINSEYFFPHETDPTRPMVKVNNGHYGALKRCGLKFRLYDLRHTAATRLALAGTDLVTLAAILGHSKIQMVLRYAHPVESQKAEAMQKLQFSTGAESVAVPKTEGVENV